MSKVYDVSIESEVSPSDFERRIKLILTVFEKMEKNEGGCMNGDFYPPSFIERLGTLLDSASDDYDASINPTFGSEDMWSDEVEFCNHMFGVAATALACVEAHLKHRDTLRANSKVEGPAE